jgi:ADP-dependent NAD(P)H-hydrate dehydratase
MRRLSELPLPPPRPVDAHKGTFGRVLVIAGSAGMSGAAVLAGRAALRGGAGLVYVAVPRSILPIVAAGEPSYLTIPLEEAEAGGPARSAAELLLARAEEMSVVALGPGCGRSPDFVRLARKLYRDAPQPLVVDADGLNALAAVPGACSRHAGPRVLTPHPGEFARLTHTPMTLDPAQRETAALQFAAAHGVVLVLKGAGTVVTDGERLYVNTTGNSGLATGGTGDVLTGLIAALLAQGMEPFEGAQLGVWMHGRAGDLLAAERSQPGLIASDLPEALCRVWKELGR